VYSNFERKYNKEREEYKKFQDERNINCEAHAFSSTPVTAGKFSLQGLRFKVFHLFYSKEKTLFENSFPSVFCRSH
jgi:hypothetical protein